MSGIKRGIFCIIPDRLVYRRALIFDREEYDFLFARHFTTLIIFGRHNQQIFSRRHRSPSRKKRLFIGNKRTRISRSAFHHLFGLRTTDYGIKFVVTLYTNGLAIKIGSFKSQLDGIFLANRILYLGSQ